MVNPYKALFNIQNWLETVINRARTQARNVMTQYSYEEWIKNIQSIGKIMRKRIGIKEFRERYGIDVRKIEVKDINPLEKYREATLAKYLAEREKDKIVIEAEAEKERIEKVYEAVQSFGDLGKLIRVCEAAEKSPLTASLTVQAIPGIQEVLKGIFGKNSDSVSKEEFKELKRTLQQIQRTLKN